MADFKKQARHGDLLIEKFVGEMRDGFKVDKSKIVEHGEVTGHAHRINGNGTVLVSDSVNYKLIEVLDEDVSIVHEEHKPITFPTGLFMVTRQREYDAYERATRNVLD